MDDLVIPPSPNWYLSNILACNDDGSVIAYGARHELTLFKTSVNVDEPCEITPSFIPMAHKERITSVAFAPSSSDSYRNMLVSCSDDGYVRVWDYETKLLRYSHSGHPEGHKLPCVDWSRADPNLIVSVSDMGSVVCWDLPSNTIRRLYIGSKVLPQCLACCPHSKDLIAVGSKAGLIIVFNLKGDGHISFRIRGHESDVISLAWCPVPENVLRKEKEENDNTWLLASGAKDRSVFFWRCGTDGRYETILHLPTQQLTPGHKKNGIAAPASQWVCVRWPQPTKLITSSNFGELLSHDLTILHDRPTEKGTKVKLKTATAIHGVHPRGLFSIAVPYNSTQNKFKIWTCALDKHLVCATTESKVLLDITTIGGIVYCMAVSPLDPNRLALGTGDNKVLVWNMSNGSFDNVSTFWNKINNKVMAIAWHPTQEGIVAFGTGEGRVGILDVGSNKPPVLLRLHHRRSVYSLIWGKPILPFEPLENVKRKWDIALFSVGDNEILQYDIDFPDKAPGLLEPLLKECDSVAVVSKSLGRSDLSWNHDRSSAAVGNDNGTLYIVDGQTFKHKHTIFAHKKLVQCVVWHPATVSSEETASSYSSWLATASDNIQVFNVSPGGVSSVASFSSHTEKVVSLVWSPHFNGRLVTASYDYTSQVWDVESGVMLACYDGHHSAVLCCLPSPIHPDKYITGSSDYTVRSWALEKYGNVNKSKTKKQRLSGALKKFEGVQEATDLNANDGSEFKTVTSKSVTNGPITVIPEDGTGVKIEAPKVCSIENKRRIKSMFPQTGSSLSLARHLEVLWARKNNIELPDTPSVEELGYLDFFGDSKAMKRLLMVEDTHHRNVGNSYFMHQNALWSGDLVGTLKDAIAKKALNEWLVGLAPMVSYKFWEECCVAYAAQLSEAGDPMKASSYLLAVHKVTEAVEALMEGKMYREAVALAKSRFPDPKDPTILKAVTAWAGQANYNGMQNLAAHCLISIGSTVEAIEVLSRSKDAHNLSLASRMAAHIQAEDMARNLAFRSITTSLQQGDYTTAQNTINAHATLKDVGLWVELYKILREKKAVEENEWLPWLLGTRDTPGEGLLETVFEISKDGTPSPSTLALAVPAKPDHSAPEKVLLYIAGQFALAVASSGTSSNSDMVLRYLISGLHAAYAYQITNKTCPNVYLQLCPWIAPKGPLSHIKVYSSQHESLSNSLKCYLACGAVYTIEYLHSKQLLPLDDNASLSLLANAARQFAATIFDKNIIDYFKNEEQIKKLETQVASEKINVLKRSGSSGESGEETPPINGGMDSIKKDKSAGDSASSPLDPKLLKLSEFKLIKKQFEEERGNSPNPYAAFISLQNVFDETLIKTDVSKEIFVEIKNMLETATATATAAA